MNIIEYLKYLSTIRDRISDLCKQSLFDKWYIESDRGIYSDCPFCEDKHKRGVSCDYCLCPPEICEDGYLNNSFFDVLVAYDYILVYDISIEKLETMISLFQKWIINEEKEDSEMEAG